MRCKQCEYRLWNLPSRTCPECGSSFAPSDFEFIPGSVRFCCPHCNQDYYGTDLKGHLVPVSFECGSCNRPVHMDEMILLPTEGVDEEETATGKLPWPDRKRIGTIKSWFRMVGMSLVTPGKLGRSIAPNASTGSAMWFAFLTTFLLAGVGVAPIMLFAFVPMMAAGPSGGGGGGPGAVGLLAALGFTLFFMCGFLFVGVLLTGLVAHGVLRLTGDTAGGLGRTYRAVFYSSGANVLTAIPCMGFYIGWIWWVVSGVIVLKEAQKVHGGRSAMAILAVPVGALAVFLIFVVGMNVMVLSSITSAPTMGTVGGSMPVSLAIADYREDHGDWPGHAIELFTKDYLEPLELVMVDPDCLTSAWSIDGTPFDDLPEQSETRREEIVQRARDALPDDVIAHRVGDCVFTYHGIDPNSFDEELWIAVASPDPECNPDAGPWPMLIVITADGEVGGMSGNPQQVLSAQNQVRRIHGLPPLPDLSTVTHSSPATGE